MPIRQFVLEVSPYPLVRVQFGGIAGKTFAVELRVVLQNLFHGLALMNAASIPEKDNRASYMTQQVP